jgi:hypothetical protein
MCPFSKSINPKSPAWVVAKLGDGLAQKPNCYGCRQKKKKKGKKLAKIGAYLNPVGFRRDQHKTMLNIINPMVGF